METRKETEQTQTTREEPVDPSGGGDPQPERPDEGGGEAGSDGE